jgi:hypothetical protein
MRRIDKIQEHLETECNEICTFCNESYNIAQEDIHLNYSCTMNFLKCNDCHTTFLQKNQARHKRRCSMRMITCKWCSDTTKFAKKDWKTHVNMNYEEHELNMCQFLKSFPFVLINLRHKIKMNKTELLESTSPSKHEYINDKYNSDIMKQEQHQILMNHIISINRGDNIKKLLIQCNMMKELHKMCLTQKHDLKNLLNEEYDSYHDDPRSPDDSYRNTRRGYSYDDM